FSAWRASLRSCLRSRRSLSACSRRVFSNVCRFFFTNTSLFPVGIGSSGHADAGRPACRHRPACVRRSTDRADVRRLRALLALGRLEFDFRALGEALEACAGDTAVMDEEVLPAVVRRDEAVPLAVVEPLDGSCCHVSHLPCALSRTGGETAKPAQRLV